MSHLPPKPDFYPPDSSRYYSRPPPAALLPPSSRYPPSRDVRDAYPPRSPPRTRAPPPRDPYVPGRLPDPYRSRPPPFVDAYHDRLEDDRYRDRDRDKRAGDYRVRPRDDVERERESDHRDRDRDRRWDQDAGVRRERLTSRERWELDDRERLARWEEDRLRQERREEDRRYFRERPREVEPERRWVSRMSRSPPRRVVTTKVPDRAEKSPPPSRARSPVSPQKQRAPPTPTHSTSRAGSPYRVERSRPIRTRSPTGEIRLGAHSISVSRTPARSRRDLSPRDADRRPPIISRRSRSRSPEPRRREARRDLPVGSRTGTSGYRGRDRRSPRRRSTTPASPLRRRSPAKRRTPSPPSRSHSRSPTRTPPIKRHILPPLKSPSRPPPPPPPTGPRIRSAPQPESELRPNLDGDVPMQDSEAAPASVSPTSPTSAPVSAPASFPETIEVAVPAAMIVSPLPHVVTPASPPAVKSSSATPSLPQKPEVQVGRKLSYQKRRSRSPPTAPRHYHMHVSTPSNRSPAYHAHHGPNLPPKPDWGRRNTAHHQQIAKADAPSPARSHVTAEPAAFVPVIPPYQPKPSVTVDIEAEIARLRSHRMHIEAEYDTIAQQTRRALNDLLVADIDLKMAEGRRAITFAQLEKARLGVLGIDYIR